MIRFPKLNNHSNTAAKQSLIVWLLLFLSIENVTASEKDKQVSWTDDQGRVHSESVTDAKQANTSLLSRGDEKKAAPAMVYDPSTGAFRQALERTHSQQVIKQIQQKPINPDEFLSSDELEQQEKEARKEKPPFYTRIDENGRVVNELVPQLNVSFSSEELLVTEIMAPPFRLSERYRKGCCQQYGDKFNQLLPLGSDDVFEVNQNSSGFKTRNGIKSAVFLNLFEKTVAEKQETETSLLTKGKPKSAYLSIKAFQMKEQVGLNLLVLDKGFLPLYSFKNLTSQYTPENWKTFASAHWQLQIDDPDVFYAILFLTDATQGAEALADYKLLIELSDRQ